MELNGVVHIFLICPVFHIYSYFLYFLTSPSVWVVSGVKRFIYISAADFGLINYLLRGYYEGKVSSSS